MNYIKCLVVCCMLFTCSCSGQYKNVLVTNPGYHPQKIFIGYEQLTSPKFSALRKKYQLDTVFHGEADEFKRILLLRNWIRKHIPINDEGPYPDDGTCESILDHALNGSGFHCGHFMVVQNAVMNAYGYVTRCLGAGPGGTDGIQNHHGINEIWLNDYHKWFLCDAKYNSHFEKNGIPLSALEVRAEYLKNKGADMVRVKGVERTPVDMDTEFNHNKESFARTYVNIEWELYSDKYTAPQTDTSDDRGILIMYNDDYFKKHVWMWDGKPHWAYHTKFMKLVDDQSAIEWTPNTIQAKVTIDKNHASIQLNSDTPNFLTYQVQREAGGKWDDISSPLETKLEGEKNELAFRAVNVAGVAGPVYRMVIKK